MSKQTLSQAELESLARQSLDESVDSMDAATLSKLNQARQAALEVRAQPTWQRWFPQLALGAAVLVVAVFLPLQFSGQTEQPGSVSDPTYLISAEDPELIDDLELMLFLVDVEDHAS